MAHPNRWRILPVLCLSLSIIMIGNGSVNIALPAISRDLHASTTALQWMVDAYALVFAGLLFTAGTIGDRYGRKGALQVGLCLFLVGAAIATMAQAAAVVILARVVMGMAAALVMPATLSILTNVFPAEERARAISIWAGIAAGGAAIGPSATGFLLGRFWWGSVFLVNLPLVVLALVAGARVVPSSKDPVSRPFDLAGAALSIAAVGGLVYAIIEAPGHGWTSPRTLAVFAAAAVAVVLFVLRERRARHPMLDLNLFRDRRFTIASIGIALAFFAMFGTFFLVTQYLQLVRGYSALSVGVALLPVSVVMTILSPQAPKLVVRFGVARVVAGGLTLTALGLTVLSTLGTGSSIAVVELAFVPMVSGIALTMTPLTTLIMSAVPLGSAGVGSAMNDTTREFGGAVGVAVLGSLVSTHFAGGVAPAVAGLPAGAADSATAGLAGALQVAATLPGPAGDALATAARSAFVDGISVAALVAAAVVFATAVVARVLLPDTRPAVDLEPASTGTGGGIDPDPDLVGVAAGD